jgi:hypothetical protein
MSEQEKIPFTIGYVVGTTAKNMLRSIDLSITKTSARMAEFSGDHAKTMEIVQTLDVLHRMRRMQLEFIDQNKHLTA